MFFVKVISILVPLLLLSFLTEFVLRRLLKTERKSIWRYRPVNHFHSSVNLILVGACFFTSFILKWLDLDIGDYVMMTFFTIFVGFRIYMEWKHDRGSKEYIITSASFSWFFLFLAGIAYF